MLVKNATYLDQFFEVKYAEYIAISNGRFEYIGNDKSLAEKMSDSKELIDASGKLMTPAFYNAHAHSPMMLMRGYGENLKLDNWLQEKIWPFEAHLNSRGVYFATLLAMAESIRTGIVSTQDMYFFTEDMVEAVINSGCKANISRAIVNFDGESLASMDSFKEMENAVKSYQGLYNGRIMIEASIHGEYTSDESTVRDLADYAKENNMQMHIHLSETQKEHIECIERRGVTPTKYFDRCGLLDSPTVAAHCVWIDDEDIAILADRNVTVAHNPTSNMKLASGICPTQELLEAGVSLALGTDSVASNNSLNFFEEMKLMALCAKIKYMDPTIISPKDVFRAATICGAGGQGRKDCGIIEIGMRADFLLINRYDVNLCPVHDVVNNLVYAGNPSNIYMTVSDGNVLYENGEYKTIDIERVIASVDEERLRILSKI